MPTYTGEPIITQRGLIEGIASLKDAPSLFSEPGVRAFDASLGAKNIRVANRKIIVTTLKKSLRFDIDITCFDINVRVGLMALCAGKIIHVVNMETLVVKNQLGKQGGSLHRGHAILIQIQSSTAP